MSPGTPNKRRYFRIDKSCVLSIRVVDVFKELGIQQEKKLLDDRHCASLKNISPCGVLIHSDQVLPLGAIVQMHITFSDWDPPYPAANGFHTIARVVRLELKGGESCEIGFEFLGVSPEEQEAMAGYLMKKAPHARSREKF